MALPVVRLKEKRDIPVRAGHPWVFSNAVEKSDGCELGSLCRVESSDGSFVGIGMFNPRMTIRVRIIARDGSAVIDKDFIVRRLKDLDDRKNKFLPPDTDGYRVVHADADDMPGLTVDRYAGTLVFQIQTAGMDRFRSAIIGALDEVFRPEAIVERSDCDSRKQEGLSDRPVGVHRGSVKGPVPFRERGVAYFADVLHGQKTGFFLDQRDARHQVRSIAKDRVVLDLFGYTGAFSVSAALAEARAVTTVDESQNALALAKNNFEANAIAVSEDGRFRFIKSNVFEFLTKNKATGDCDFIICDPPAFTKSREKKDNALEAYTKLNALCLSKLDIGGILMTSCCSGMVTGEEFRSALRLAAGHVGRELRVLARLGQPFDHTDKISFPEGRYLTTFFAEVVRKMQ